MTPRFIKSDEMIVRDLVAAVKLAALFTICAGCVGFLALLVVKFIEFWPEV